MYQALEHYSSWDNAKSFLLYPTLSEFNNSRILFNYGTLYYLKSLSTLINAYLTEVIFVDWLAISLLILYILKII